MRRFAQELARGSGAVLMEKLHQHRTIRTKSTLTDLVTDADLASEQWLVEQLRTTYPDHAILGEEGTGSLDLLHQGGYVWIIDPLDGTVNFAHQIPLFAVSIALLHHGVLELGVIYLPALDELFVAERGRGATLNDVPIHVSKTAALHDALLASGFSYDKHTSPQDNLENVNIFVKKIRGFRRMGSAALDLAYTACGRLDAYWEDKIKPWDIAAGVLLVQEAGGHVSGFSGAPLQLDAGHIIASNGPLHTPIQTLLRPYAERFQLGLP